MKIQKGLWTWTAVARCGGAAAMALCWGVSASAEYSINDTLEWLEANKTATPTFEAGDVIGEAEADSIRPFVPPPYQEIMIFAGMEVEIGAPSDISPHELYEQATLQHQGQVRMAEDGALENYIAGEPFDETKFKAGDRMDGHRAIWNFNYRWQAQGLSIDDVIWVWVREGGNHEGLTLPKEEYLNQFKGGGSFQRVLWGPYQRAYFNHRADLPEQDYRVRGNWTEGTEFREYTGFSEPFDIRGTAFLILRYTDPRRADDAWAYIPNLRRVRRISVEVKSDSLLGTDHTLEDFYCFSGRVLEHDWKYIDTARILAKPRSKYPTTRYYGPNGWAVKDRWELREVDVFQQIPTLENHPYSSKLLFTDRQNHTCFYAEGFDQGGELWKTWQLDKIWSEDDVWGQGERPGYGEQVRGLRVTGFQGINVIDHQNGRGTLVPCNNRTYHTNSLAQLKRVLDVNNLSEGR